MSDKKTKFIDKQIYHETTEDPFRRASNKYWHNIEVKRTSRGTSAPIPSAENNLYFGLNDDQARQRIDLLPRSGSNIMSFIKEVRVCETQATGICDPAAVEGGGISRVDTVHIIGDPGKIKNDRHWNSLLMGGPAIVDGRPEVYVGIFEDSTTYFDFVFDVPMPYEGRELENIDTPHTRMVNINTKYNYFEKDYERSPGYFQAPEQILPNLYVFLSEVSHDEKMQKNYNFKDLITLKGQFPLNVKAIKLNENFDYFRNWGKIGIGRFLKNSPQPAQQLQERFGNILVPINNMDLITDFNSYKSIFPMYTEVKFSTDTSTLFAEALKDSKLTCAFMKDMFEAFSNITPAIDEYKVLRNMTRAILGGDTSAVSALLLGEVTAMANEIEALIPSLMQDSDFMRHDAFPRFQDVSADGRVSYDYAQTINEQFLLAMDLDQWFDYFYTYGATPFTNTGVFLGSEDEEILLAQEDQYEFYKNMLMQILGNKIRTIAKTYLRTFDQIMNGEGCYSETIMYRIEKVAMDRSRQNVAGSPDENANRQSFWIPNSNDIDIVEYIDTQVKYNTRYRYTIYAYQMVVATEYRYNNLSISKIISEKDDLVSATCIEMFSADSGEVVEMRCPDKFTVNPVSGRPNIVKVQDKNKFVAEFDVHQFPKIRIVQVPIYRTETTMIDNPPLAPAVSFYPYQNISNKIKFNLNASIGSLEDKPVILNKRDLQAANKIWESLPGLSFLNRLFPITFESDGDVRAYEVYRTTKHPTSYDSFKDSYLTKVTGGPATEYIDNILPNTKYYYMFRALDIHENVSNPSAVYEIELVDDNGAIYPTVRVVEFDPVTKTTPTRSGKRLLHLQASLEHILINETQSGLFRAESATVARKNIVLGHKDPNPFTDKKFKLRLTSKKTGRKIDINLTFKRDHQKTEYEYE